jgi:hypothetical protein
MLVVVGDDFKGRHLKIADTCAVDEAQTNERSHLVGRSCKSEMPNSSHWKVNGALEVDSQK